MSTTVALTLAAAQERLSAAGVDDARLEAELLLAHALGGDRARVIAMLGEPLDGRMADALETLLTRRLRREPLAYITGQREFYGLDISCSAAALIPRPETELLVDIVLAEPRRRGVESARIIDVGTGTGAIACAIAVHAAGAHVTATDVSDEALALAAANAERLGVSDRVQFRRTDLLRGLGQFDIILANLPYVTELEWRALAPEVRDFEPKLALVPGPCGTEANEALLAGAAEHSASGAVLALEMGASQAAALSASARACFPGAEVSVIKDLAGRDCVLMVRRA